MHGSSRRFLALSSYVWGPLAVTDPSASVTASARETANCTPERTTEMARPKMPPSLSLWNSDGHKMRGLGSNHLGT